MEKRGMLNDQYPTRVWYNEDGSIDFGSVEVPSKSGGKGSYVNEQLGGPAYTVIVNPAPDRPGGVRLECGCPGFEYRTKCRHVELVRDELQKKASAEK